MSDWKMPTTLKLGILQPTIYVPNDQNTGFVLGPWEEGRLKAQVRSFTRDEQPILHRVMLGHLVYLKSPTLRDGRDSSPVSQAITTSL